MSAVPTLRPSMQSRIPYADYVAMEGLRFSALKNLARSPLHYQHALAHPKQTDPMRLGTAAHVAVLEPERFESQFVVWEKRKSNGDMWPRKGPEWDAFCAEHRGREALEPKFAEQAQEMQRAVQAHPKAQRYLQSGDPEVSLQCTLNHRLCKARIDWLTTVDGAPVMVGLKTTVDVRAFQFRRVAAQLLYHVQWAFYADMYHCVTSQRPRVVEIVVEKTPPYAVGVYVIRDEILQQGREQYQALMAELARCEAADEWPGPVVDEQELTLPDWAYANTDDASGLGLEW